MNKNTVISLMLMLLFLCSCRNARIASEHPVVPAAEEIKAFVTLTRYTDLKVFPSRSAAYISYKRQMADPGGNICVLGNGPDGKPWKVGSRDPHKQRGISIGYLELSDKAVSTSGAYERFFKSGGIQYHHIINPSTGYPSTSDLVSTTIASSSSVDTDALSTATFVLGKEKGMDEIRGSEYSDAVFVTKDNRVFAASVCAAFFT